MKAYRGSTPVNLYDILLHSSQHKITTFSQISQILEKVENSSADIHSKLKAAGKTLLSLCDPAIDDDETRKKLEFICTQLSTHYMSGQHQGKQYSSSRQTIQFIKANNTVCTYEVEMLTEPYIWYWYCLWKNSPLVLWKIWLCRKRGECVQAVIDVFSTLEDHGKFVFISADEIYVKPAIRYMGGNVLGFAQNHDTTTPAKTVLAAMINFLRGSPAFVARLVPVANLKHEFLVDLLLVLVSIYPWVGWACYGHCEDNLSVNQKTFKTLREKFTPRSNYSIEHPVENDRFSTLRLLYDVTHLKKNIRNNWITEKNRTLEFLDPFTNKTLIVKWSDLVFIDKMEENNMVRNITLDYQSLYPNNFEKQKVQLVFKVFNEKTVACLERYDRKDTARFVSLVTRMWNMLNVKSPEAGRRLNDPEGSSFCRIQTPDLISFSKWALLLNFLTLVNEDVE